MKIDTLLGGKMISTYEYREGFIGSDAYKTYAPLKILGPGCISDMKFVKNFTPPDFQAKHFTPSISPNFNSFSDKNTNK